MFVQVGGQEAKIVGGVDSTSYAGAEKFKWIAHLYMEDELYSYGVPHALFPDFPRIAVVPYDVPRPSSTLT